LLVFIALLVLLPSLPANRPVTPRAILDQLRSAPLRAGVIATMLIVTGQFVAFTFISPILQQIAGFEQGAISSLLLAYGAAGIAGNFLAGAAAGRDERRTVHVITIALTSTIALFPLLGASQAGGITLLIAWGLAFGGVSVTLQTWMLKAAPQTPEAASALWVAAFNLSIALGALTGGLLADAIALDAVLWLSAALIALTALAVRSGATRVVRHDESSRATPGLTPPHLV
jgi:predicted MFS family arabinose efflux permease